jgi:hypothetical protein
VRTIADWIAATNDAADGPFVVVDKTYARLHVFDADARLVDSTPILLGGARGDDTVPGIGSRPIELVRPDERTTPAGRFVGQRGRNARGEDVVWVDYDSGVSMHRVLTTDPSERRLERLATPTHLDNRISWGCINVPVGFYEARLRPDVRDANRGRLRAARGAHARRGVRPRRARDPDRERGGVHAARFGARYPALTLRGPARATRPCCTAPTTSSRAAATAAAPAAAGGPVTSRSRNAGSAASSSRAT